MRSRFFVMDSALRLMVLASVFAASFTSSVELRQSCMMSMHSPTTFLPDSSFMAALRVAKLFFVVSTASETCRSRSASCCLARASASVSESCALRYSENSSSLICRSAAYWSAFCATRDCTSSSSPSALI